MNIYREIISYRVFEALIKDIWSIYFKKFREIKPENIPPNKRKEILAIKDYNDFINPPHGLSKHIFAKKGDPEYFYSVGAIIAKELKELSGMEPDIDLSDFLYKKCIDFRNKKGGIEIYNTFYRMFGFDSLEEYCRRHKLVNEVSTVVNYRKSAKNIYKEIEDKLQAKLTGGWVLYSYNNEDSSKESLLAYAIVEIVSLNNIKLLNAATESSINYIGQIDNEMTKISGVVYFKFQPDDKGKESRNLRIALHISEDVNFDMAIGQYTNVDRASHLIRGSICMYRINDYKIGEGGKYMKDLKVKGGNKEIEEYFKRFLSDKNLNFNRLPNNQYNSDSFGNWLDVQEAKRKFLIKRRALENKKLFISCPIHSVTPNQFNDLKEIVKKITGWFKGKKFIEVYSFINELENQEATANFPSTLEYQKVRRKYEECNYHLVIWPLDLKPSGIIFEIGWAAIKDRPVVIFEQVSQTIYDPTKSQIPHLLLGACENKNTEIVRFAFKELGEIISILDKNYMDIFPNQLTINYS